MKNPERILIIQTAFIGDVILTLPLIEAVHKKYHGCAIDLMITPKAYDLVKANPYVNNIIIYDKRGKDKGIKSFLGMVRRVRNNKYNLAVLPHRSLRTAMLAFSAGIPERVGFDRSAGKTLLTKVIKYSWDKHDAERNLDLIQQKNEEKRIPVFLDKEDIKKAEIFLKENGILGKDILIGIAPGSAWATKKWPEERFSELAAKLIEKYRAGIVIIGGKEDESLAEKIKDTHNRGIVIAAGKLSLGKSAAVISKCRLFITNDTAPLHLASAFKVPTAAIFGPTTTGLGFGPYGSLNIVIEKNLPCRPCGRHGHRECPEGHFKCMKAIGTDEVFAACRRLLK